MKKLSLCFLFLICLPAFASDKSPPVSKNLVDVTNVGVYVTPFYNSEGPQINVGPFSKGLSAKDEKTFLATIAKMKQNWDQLTFLELYVAAARLYDLGYRKEAVYWYYTAQYRGRLFCMIIDQNKMGGIGDMGFELYQAQSAFMQLCGAVINAYAFDDIDGLVTTLQRVKKEGEALPLEPLMSKYYSINFQDDFALPPSSMNNNPKMMNVVVLNKNTPVKFQDKSTWSASNKKNSQGMTGYIDMLKTQKAELQKGRKESGIAEACAKLQNKELPAQ